jgi:hypothetical protein
VFPSKLVVGSPWFLTAHASVCVLCAAMLQVPLLGAGGVPGCFKQACNALTNELCSSAAMLRVPLLGAGGLPGALRACNAHKSELSCLLLCCRFRSSEQVEFLARCVHAFDPVTDLPLADATALGGLVIQVRKNITTACCCCCDWWTKMLASLCVCVPVGWSYRWVRGLSCCCCF